LFLLISVNIYAEECDLFFDELTRVEYATMKEMQDAIAKLKSNGKFFGAWVEFADGDLMGLSLTKAPECKDE